MGVKFDSAGAMAELKANLVLAMRQLQDEFYNEAGANMNTPEGRDSLYKGDVEVIADAITAQVIGGAYAAMDEYGTGSLLDESNPFLDEYMASDQWNPHRDRDEHKIVSRSRADGSYVDIFGETRTSRSNRGGIDLEKRGGKFAPQPPSHALQTAARWMENGRFQEVLQEAVARVDWVRHFVETRE